MDKYLDYLVALAAAIAAVLLVKLPEKLGGTFICPSGNAVCEWGSTVAVLALAPLLAIVLFRASASLVRRSVRGIRLPRSAPRIKIWFELPEANDLEIYIKNEKNSREAFVMCSNISVLTLGGTRYMDAFPEDLGIVRDSLGGNFPILRDRLVCNDTREIRIAWPFNEKLSLHYLSQDAPVSGFRDGVIEYAVGCEGRCGEQSFRLPPISVFLTIKDGSLIQIRDKL